MGAHGLAILAIAMSTMAGPAPAGVEPAGCAWHASAQRMLDALQPRADASAARWRGLLSGALAACARPYFSAADWLWEPIVADPVLDPGSAAMAAELATGEHIVNIGDFGVTLVGPAGITAATPRFPVTTTAEFCRENPITEPIPVPEGTPVPPGSDGHLAVADPVRRTVANLWIARQQGASYTAGCGSQVPLDGDGRETAGGSSTGSNIARFAAVGRIDEIAAGVIPHALFLSTNMAKEGELRYPAVKTDGANNDGVATPIPEGARIQLDPAVDVAALGLPPAQATIARTLQTYGAYVGDNGGARVALLFEYGPGSPVYRGAGLAGGDGGFAGIEGIPWDRLRVLASWDGAAAQVGVSR